MRRRVPKTLQRCRRRHPLQAPFKYRATDLNRILVRPVPPLPAQGCGYAKSRTGEEFPPSMKGG